MEETRGRYGRYTELDSYRKDAVQAADDLFYGDKVISLVRKAKTIREISDIMCNARHGKYA